MMNYLTIVFITVSFIYSTISFARQDKIKFDHITIKNGLSNDRVCAILQDSHGFMWFGTMEGLNRYDGSKFKIFRNNPHDSTSISNNYILSLYEDKQGTLWVGTINGLNQFVREKETFIRYQHDSTDANNPSCNTIDVIYEDRSGILWIGLYGGGLNRFDKKSQEFTTYMHGSDNPNSLSNNNVYAIHADRSGLMWIGTGYGLNSFDTNTGVFKHYYHVPENLNSLSANAIYSIHEDINGALWLGTRGGLVELDVSRKKFTRYGKSDKSLSSLKVPTIIFKVYGDHKDNLWLATSTCGLSEFNLKTKSFITHLHDIKKPASISANRTMTSYLDRQGTHWVGTRDNGINSYNPLRNKFHTFNIRDVVPDHLRVYIKSLYIDGQNILWIGASPGLFQFNSSTGKYNLLSKSRSRLLNSKMNPGNARSVQISSALYSYNIIDFYEDKENILWIASDGGGLHKFDIKNNILVSFKHEKNNSNSLISNYLDCVLKDSFGMVWIQTWRGKLNILDISTGIITRHTKKTRAVMGLSNEYISMFYEDKNGILWIATHGDGLYRYNQHENNFTSFKHNPDELHSISDNVVNTIYESKSRQLWIGTANGLNKFDSATKRLYSYNLENGLASSHIKGILEDGSGNLWINSHSGISKFDIEKESFINYNEQDGIDIKFAEDNVCAKDSNGYMYFAGKDGVVFFHPDSIVKNTHTPPIVITNFKLLNKLTHLDSSIIEKKKITLPYDHNFFTLEFAALDYIAPAKNRYAYMLEGLDKNWNYTLERTAHYTNIAPGKYTFQVRGSNNDGLWNEEGTSIRITILPPWWKTWWAYSLYFCLAVVVILGVFRFEIKRRETEHRAVVAELQAETVEVRNEADKEQMRRRIAGDLHDEIGGNLSSIAMLGQTLEQKTDLPAPEKERLKKIPQIALLTAESMRDIVWFVNPANDSFEKLLAKMRETANLMLEGMDVDINFNIDKSNFNNNLNFRRNLFFLYKEILQNIIRHAKASKVIIELNQNESHLTLSVTDNGVGFSTKAESSGNGLHNCQRRTEEMGGKISVNSGVNKGTMVKFSIKIP